jgi:drug/metabolite transporter (DMT)-like permease
MTNQRKSIFLIHFCVVLWGFTAILGALISLESIPLVLWRVALAGVVLLVMVGYVGWQKIPNWVLGKLVLIGVLIGMHWVCFYGAIKLANASIGVVTISTASFFTAISEPLIAKTKLNKRELLVGLLIIPGILLVAGSVDLNMRAGFFVGIIAAALVGIFANYTKVLLNAFPSLQVMQASMIQMWAIFIFLMLCLPVFIYFMPEAQVWPSAHSDWVYLVILSCFCTVLPFTLSMQAMKHISPFTSNLIMNLEPIYGILLAVLILDEDKELNIWFYLGVFIILVVVFGHSLIRRKQSVNE